jgi:chromosome segregation ATPase
MSRNKSNKIDKISAGWKRALAEAERQIKQYKRKIHELNGSMKIMQETIASGEPYPGAR